VATDEKTSSFLKEAADGGMAEVRLGEMALQKSTNQRVKNFANMMVTDHSGANSKVKSFASERNITLPTDVSDKHKETMDDLMKKEGKDFDKAYVKAMVEDHEKDIKKFEDAEGKVNDATVKNFITATLPVLRTHLDSIQGYSKSHSVIL
jgi:putative membrane protein